VYLIIQGVHMDDLIVYLCSMSTSCRGFNDAINGFNDDGWSLMNADGAEDVIIAVNSTKNLIGANNSAHSLSFLGGILCAKASMLLQVSFETMITNFLLPIETIKKYFEGNC
jgi:hypothetical protein